MDSWIRDDLEEVSVKLWRGLKRFAHQRKTEVTDSEDIVRKREDEHEQEREGEENKTTPTPHKPTATVEASNERRNNK